MITNKIIISGNTAGSVIISNINRTFLQIQNIGSRIVFLTGSNTIITSNIGFPLAPGDTYSDGIYTGDYWAVSYNGSNTTLSVIEEQQYPT